MKIETSLGITPVLEKIILRYCGLESSGGHDQKKLRALAHAVRAISDHYVSSAPLRNENLFTREHALNAYILYYLPVNLVKLYPILDELESHDGVPLFGKESFSLLDLGCGPGTFMLGFLEYLSHHQPKVNCSLKRLSLTGIDQEADNLAAASQMLHAYMDSGLLPADIVCTTAFKRASLTEPQGYTDVMYEKGPFDVIIAGNVFTELREENPAPFIKSLESRLTAQGVLLIIDPGTKTSSGNLIMLRDLILKETSLALYAPCIQTAMCPLTRAGKEWCHEKIFWDPPAAIREIDDMIGFTKEKGIKYAYLTFTKQKALRSDAFAGVPQDKIWRVVSYRIKSKGQERLYVCNGSERIPLRLLLRNTSEHNEDFFRAKRGNLVFVDAYVQHIDFLDIRQDSIFKILYSCQ